MKYKRITYRRVKNLGNYENEQLEIEVQLDIDVNESKKLIDEAVQEVRRTCVYNLIHNIDEKELISDDDEIPFA